MTVKKISGGYKVVSERGKAFSKKPQTKAKAQAQLRAIEANRGKKAQ